MKNINFPRLTISLPTFLPDATYGNVKALDFLDVENCGIDALVMNVFHLMQHPGSSTIRSLGGVHNMYHWKGIIFTDSGGFQVYSLLKNDPQFGSVSDKGFFIRTQKVKKHILLTPEKSIQNQLRYGADAIYCLDECTHPDTPLVYQEKSVERTIQWAKRCKNEYNKLLQSKGFNHEEKPKIFAVIQGGRSFELRKRCIEGLLDVGFDGFGYGGWPIEETGELLIDIIEYIREMIPDNYPLHMLGVGQPRSIKQAALIGWDIFDSSLPTRDARRGRLFSFSEKDIQYREGFTSNKFDYLYIGDKKNIKRQEQIVNDCECFCCCNFSIGFLHHLFKLDDHLYYRLATIHNLFYISSLCKHLRAERCV